jgi:hypothetical protein
MNKEKIFGFEYYQKPSCIMLVPTPYGGNYINALSLLINNDSSTPDRKELLEESKKIIERIVNKLYKEGEVQ